MDLTGLLIRLAEAAINIESGRKGFTTIGKEAEGRVYYEKGIAEALAVFKEVHATADPYTIVFAEYTFLVQELNFCDKTDKSTIKTLANGIQNFDYAFITLPIVEKNAIYKEVEKTYPHYKHYRAGNLPKDAFHYACNGHKVRLGFMLNTPGINRIEKTLIKQRLANIGTARKSYIEKQKIALSSSDKL